MFHQWRDPEPQHILKLLKQLQSLFSDPNKWISWPLAENYKGEEVKPSDPTAARYCLMGACQLFTETDYTLPLAWFVDCATREYLNDLSGDAIIHNKTTYEDEVRLINEAIEDIQKEINK